MNRRLFFTITLLSAIIWLCSFFAPPKKRNGKLFPDTDTTARRGWVDTIISANGNKFHLITSSYRDYIPEQKPYSYYYLVETYDNKGYKDLVALVKEHSPIKTMPASIVLYATDTNINTIVSGDYTSVVGILAYYRKGSAYIHYGFIKNDGGFTLLGSIKSKYNDKAMYCDDVSGFLNDSVRILYPDANALCWFSRSRYWNE